MEEDQPKLAKGRKIAILVAAGVAIDEIRAMQSALVAENVKPGTENVKPGTGQMSPPSGSCEKGGDRSKDVGSSRRHLACPFNWPWLLGLGLDLDDSYETSDETGDRSNVATERKLRERRGVVEGCGSSRRHLACPFSLSLVAGLRT
jgi:hypothetical protein